MDRRSFLKQTGIAAGMTAVQSLRADTQGVSIIVDPQDPVAAAKASTWAIHTLQEALGATGISAKIYPRIDAAPSGTRNIIVAGSRNATAQQILKAANVTMQPGPEGLGLVAGKVGGKSALLVSGTDERGAVYAVLELADRVKYSSSLDVKSPIVEKPANNIRSCARCFVSDVEDKSWFYDRALWSEYLTALATHRFNRFNMTLGIGYNSAHNIPDSYFYFPYPFLLPVPGYNVTAVGLPDAERDRNMETLKFICEQTVARGLQFNLALWSHAYEWPNTDSNYKISGLTPETHAAYCRDGLAALLKACPGITGLSFRVHTESGIPDGRYDFWETLFSAIKNSGRKIDLDVHAKGTDERHIAIARATGMPVSMAPKFWAEHLGMPYHQAAIRELEFQPLHPRAGRTGADNSITAKRNFLRYGYGDYLKDTRQYGIIHRVWPGTQRHLLWGDPAMAAGYGRAFSFSGSLGVEWFEPLSFKGRMGSGIAGGRIAYLDKSLDPKWDWQKYDYQYRVWGRYTYNPDTDPDGHRRYLRRQLQAAAPHMETSLSNASRILPVITTAHGASGSNNTYWPEMYTNMPIVDANRAQPYGDTADPKVFGNVSAFDPQLFCTANECAAALVSDGAGFAKYTPLDVAQWLEDMSATAINTQAQGIASAHDKNSPELRRIAADIEIQAGTGKFFAYKLRSSVLWQLYQNTGDRRALTEALKAYHTARDAWASMAEDAKKIYADNLTYGPNANMRGHWLDRIAGIDGDLADMETRLHNIQPLTPAVTVDTAVAQRAIDTALARPNRLTVAASHTPAANFDPGKPVEVSVAFNANRKNRKVNLFYRQADQSQRWHSVEMQGKDNEFRSTIPGDYTQSPYPIQYYFEVHEPTGSTIFPGFSPDLSNQPYILVRSGRAPA
jgi:hypothetical protein